MAKRTNITRIIKNEIEKGNIYVADNGNFFSGEMIESGIKEDFAKEVRKPDFDISMTLEQFKQKKLEGMKKAEDLLSHINTFFGITEEVTKEEVTAE